MSYQNRKVAVVVPAHNEARFIGDVIKAIPPLVDLIIVVDDGSSDETCEVVRRIADRRVELVRLEVNSGLGAAMVTGYRQALKSDADIVVKMDGDGQMSADDLPCLLEGLDGEYGYVKGNRFLAGSPRPHMPSPRFFGNLVLTFLTKLASGYWHIFDAQNGYTAIRASVLRLLDLDAIDKGFFFENDMLVQLNIHNVKVKDVPMLPKYGEEKSDIRPLSVTLRFPYLLIKRFLFRIYRKYMVQDFSPVALFLVTGALLFFWGVSFGLLLLVRSNLTGTAAPTGTIMLSVVPLFLGFQLILQALVLDIQESPR